jgi:hypothetical protein
MMTVSGKLRRTAMRFALVYLITLAIAAIPSVTIDALKTHSQWAQRHELSMLGITWAVMLTLLYAWIMA